MISQDHAAGWGNRGFNPLTNQSAVVLGKGSPADASAGLSMPHNFFKKDLDALLVLQ